MASRILRGSVLLAAAAALAACSSGSSSRPPVGGSVTPGNAGPIGSAAPDQPGTSTSAAAEAVSGVTVRWANLFTVKGQAGPGLDIYDTPPGQAAKPLLTDVGYGTVTAYVHPRLEPNSTNITQLYALPTGADPVADRQENKGIGGFQDDGSHPQVTVLLTGEKDTIEDGPLGGLSFGERVEKGTDNGSAGPIAPPPPAGTGEFLADDSQLQDAVPNGSATYLMIDSRCDAPANGDPNEKGLPEIFAADGVAPKSGYAVFPESPGTHSVSAVHSDITSNLTCAQLTARQGTVSFDLQPGQQVETYVYGTSLTDLHVLLAPIQP